MVIRRMIRDLHFNVKMHVCPTVREADGFAMSSRNTYLTPAQRQYALVLYKALTRMKDMYGAGTRHAPALKTAAEELIEESRKQVQQLGTEDWEIKLDYISIASPDDLHEIQDDIPQETGCILSGAVFVGKTRIIDNLLIDVPM